MLILLAPILTACIDKNDDDAVTIDIKDSQSYNLEDIAADIKVIPIKASQPIGSVRYAKCYEDETFLWDSNIIYHIVNGELQSVLNAVGRGPGEYTSISFAYLKESKELLVASPGSGCIMVFQVPSMKHIRDIKLNCYVNAMEASGDDEIVVARESKSDGSLAIEKINLRTDERQLLLHGNYFPIEMSNDCAFTGEDKGCLFFYPGVNNTLYRIDSLSMDAIGKYNFGKHNLPDKYYEWTPAQGDLDISTEVTDNQCVLLPQFVMSNSRGTSFWFVSGINKNASALPQMMFTFRSSDKSYVAKEISITGIKDALQPKGVCGDYYMSILPSSKEELIDTTVQQSPLASDIINVADKQSDYNPIILLYRFN